MNDNLDEYVRLVTDRIVLVQCQNVPSMPATEWADTVRKRVRGMCRDGTLSPFYKEWLADPQEMTVWYGAQKITQSWGHFSTEMVFTVLRVIGDGGGWSNIDEWGLWSEEDVYGYSHRCRYFDIVYGTVVPVKPGYGGSRASVDMVV